MSDENADLAGKADALEGELLGKAEADPSGNQSEPTGRQSTTGELIAALLEPTFQIMAPAWNVSSGECSMLGEAYGAVVDKYFPNFSFGVELSAVMVTLAVFGPRWGQPMKPTKKAENGEESKSAG